MFDIGAKELIIIGVILALLFGSKKIPELAKVVAEAIKNLRRGFKDDLKQEFASTHENQDKKK